MKLAARLIRLYFIIFILHSSVLGNNCSDEELNKLGMLDGPDFEKEKLFAASHGLGKVGKNFGLKIKPKVDHILNDIMKVFGEYGIEGVSAKCLPCFAQSLLCFLQNCRGPCLGDPCSEGCQNCFKRNCEEGLLKCIGKDKIKNPCDYGGEYLKYKPQKTDGDESAKKGEASGTS
uniref:CD8+ T cell target antigen Tp2 n=1 Tax=Theileria parva TaxID=5875 RepID=F6LWP2_THEPA|nr:CD8+ T cell target antigen Tp2 [Theileria parva]